jgi:hypothetical protein
MGKSLTKKPAENFISLIDQTNIHIWVVHYIVQQSALNAMQKNQIQQINHSSPQNLFILNSGFLRGKAKPQNKSKVSRI